jgi:hypothetical protein
MDEYFLKKEIFSKETIKYLKRNYLYTQIKHIK